jgi:DNA mismatch endonuclease (patch repair protein)
MRPGIAGTDLSSPATHRSMATKMDTLSRKDRSKLMAKIRSSNTGPEREMRNILRRLGVRHRKYVRGLPGTPDFVLAQEHTVIFVHGCFWHQHHGCAMCRTPKTRRTYWRDKFEGNRRRDERTTRQLRRLGWRVLTIWECNLSKPSRVEARLESLLGLKPRSNSRE